MALGSGSLARAAAGDGAEDALTTQHPRSILNFTLLSLQSSWEPAGPPCVQRANGLCRWPAGGGLTLGFLLG